MHGPSAGPASSLLITLDRLSCGGAASHQLLASICCHSAAEGSVKILRMHGQGVRMPKS